MAMHVWNKKDKGIGIKDMYVAGGINYICLRKTLAIMKDRRARPPCPLSGGTKSDIIVTNIAISVNKCALLVNKSALAVQKSALSVQISPLSIRC